MTEAEIQAEKDRLSEWHDGQMVVFKQQREVMDARVATADQEAINARRARDAVYAQTEREQKRIGDHLNNQHGLLDAALAANKPAA